MEGEVRTCWKGTTCEEHLILKYAAYIICKFARMGLSNVRKGRNFTVLGEIFATPVCVRPLEATFSLPGNDWWKSTIVRIKFGVPKVG